MFGDSASFRACWTRRIDFYLPRLAAQARGIHFPLPRRAAVRCETWPSTDPPRLRHFKLMFAGVLTRSRLFDDSMLPGRQCLPTCALTPCASASRLGGPVEMNIAHPTSRWCVRHCESQTDKRRQTQTQTHTRTLTERESVVFPSLRSLNEKKDYSCLCMWTR